jgi:hypothetical protein
MGLGKEKLMVSGNFFLKLNLTFIRFNIGVDEETICVLIN